MNAMNMTARGLGGVLLLLATIFVWQIGGLAAEIRALPQPSVTPTPGGGVSMDLRRYSIHHFYFTREAFIMLHVWLFWLLVRLKRDKWVPALADRALAGTAVVVLAAGHVVGVWLARQGASVAVW